MHYMYYMYYMYVCILCSYTICATKYATPSTGTLLEYSEYDTRTRILVYCVNYSLL